MAMVCISHTPLMGFNEPDPEVRADFDAMLDRVRQFVSDFQPTLVISFAPDHYNGFFYDVMPPYAVCLAADGVGDFGTRAGPVPVPEKTAMELAEFLAGQEFDVTISRAAQLDHGAMQIPELILGEIGEVPLIPVFINSVAPPFVPMRRIRLLGQAVGEFAAQLDERVLVLGSGGLSHDPPVPRWDQATDEQRQFLLAGRNPTPEARAARQQRTIDTGIAFARGEATIQDLNPAWDATFMDVCASGQVLDFDAYQASAMTEAAGHSSHEVRCWVAACAALAAQGAYRIHERWYRAIPEWIAGFGVLTATAISHPTTV